MPNPITFLITLILAILLVSCAGPAPVMTPTTTVTLTDSSQPTSRPLPSPTPAPSTTEKPGMEDGSSVSPAWPHTVPFTVCQSSTTWTRPSQQEQAETVWNVPRRQATPRVMLWWVFQQDFYRYLGGNSEAFDMWPELGLWTSDEPYTCAGERIKDIATGHIIEVWTLNHRVVAAQQKGHVYTVTVEPAEAGYQIVHLPGPDVTRSLTLTARAPVTATLNFVDRAGREIDHLPKLAPWNVAPTAREAVTVTGTVIDNAHSAQVVSLEDLESTRWHVPWIESTLLRWPDGRQARFQDLTHGMRLQVVGLVRTNAVTPHTLSAVRVDILE